MNFPNVLFYMRNLTFFSIYSECSFHHQIHLHNIIYEDNDRDFSFFFFGFPRHTRLLTQKSFFTYFFGGRESLQSLLIHKKVIVVGFFEKCVPILTQILIVNEDSWEMEENFSCGGKRKTKPCQLKVEWEIKPGGNFQSERGKGKDDDFILIKIQI